MFKNPPKSARPMVRWWWPGMDVEESELLREIAELDETGFYGVEIQVFWLGLSMKMKSDDPERFNRCHRFLQPYYFEMVKSVLDECGKRGMIADLTICSSWPAGGVHVGRGDAMQTMLPGTIVVEGNTHYKGDIPGFIKPFFYEYEKEFFPKLFGLDESSLEFLSDEMKLFRLLAVKVIGEGGKYSQAPRQSVLLDMDFIIDLTDSVRGNTIEWDVPDGVWQLFSFYYGPSGASPLGDARECADGKSAVIDHLSAEPIRRYLEYHLGRGKSYFGEYFGQTLRAFFTDSLELTNECFWTPGFLEKFRQLRGYDLAPYLPIMYVPDKDNSYRTNKPGPGIPCFDFQGDLGSRIRYDVQLTISDLFTEKFAGTMAEWADSNGLKSRIQSYGIRADILKVWGVSHIPETETLYAGGVIDFLKMAGSAGVIYNKRIVTAEAMSWNDRDFMTTPQKIKVTADRLFVSGVNQLIFHGFPYHGEGFSYPGYRPFSNTNLDKSLNFSSFFGRGIPHWKYIPKLNEYIARCQYILQQGQTVCNVGVYYDRFNYSDLTPQYEEMVKGVLDETDASLPAGVRLFDEPNGRERLDVESLEYIKKQVTLGDDLMKNGYYYVHVNEDRILNCEIENGKAVIGSAEIGVLIIPYAESISLLLAKRLKIMHGLGVKILLVGSIPLKQPGFFNYEQNDAGISMIMNSLANSDGCFIPNGQNAAAHIGRKLGILPGLKSDEDLGCIHYIHKRIDESDYYFIRYNQNKQRRISVRFPFGKKDKRVPFALDPWTGNIAEAAQYNIQDDDTEIVIFFEAYASTIIEFRPGTPSVHVTTGNGQAVREGNALSSFFITKGEYPYTIHPAGIRHIKIERDAPEKIPLGPWRLTNECRDVDGSTRDIAVELAELMDWREIPGFRYHSGKGKYRSEVTLGQEYFEEGLRLFLELGRVQDVAVIEVNGVALEPLLVYPYTADITGWLAPGVNKIEITVVTTLRNRLVGYGETGDPEYANYACRELMPAGLIGPVLVTPKWKVKIWDQQ